jgi:hypothetical protein
LCFPAVEKVLAPDRLAVLPNLDLDPGCRVRRVAGVRLLRYDPLMFRSRRSVVSVRLGDFGPIRLILLTHQLADGFDCFLREERIIQPGLQKERNLAIICCARLQLLSVALCLAVAVIPASATAIDWTLTLDKPSQALRSAMAASPRVPDAIVRNPVVLLKENSHADTHISTRCSVFSAYNCGSRKLDL